MRDESTVVRLAIPAAPEFLRLARLAAADVASRAGFSFEDIEDLRIGVDELCHLLMAPGTEDEELELTFTLAPDAVTVEGEGPPRAPSDPVVVQSELSKQIVTAVVNEHEVNRTDDGASRFRLRKHLKKHPPAR
jgi:anti-sigma regulatory factor (Ser/Thr protein kinase)